MERTSRHSENSSAGILPSKRFPTQAPLAICSPNPYPLIHMPHNGLRAHSLVATSLGAIIVIVAFVLLVHRFNPVGDFWGTVEPPKAQCEAYSPEKLVTLSRATTELYDQHALDRLIREPQNTVTNLAYVFVGIAALALGFGVLERSFGLAGVFLGTGSGLYHASLLPEWRLIDMMGVYAILFALALIGFVSVTEIHLPKLRQLLVAGLSWLAAVWCTIHRNDFRWWGFKPLDSTTVVLVMIALCTILAIWKMTRLGSQRTAHHWAFLLGTATLGPLAGAGGQGDRFHGFWADPTALIQGHSVWHVAGAAALLCCFALFTLSHSQSSPAHPRRPIAAKESVHQL